MVLTRLVRPEGGSGKQGCLNDQDEGRADGFPNMLKFKLQDAESLLIVAGAGMGVDSGLPDFRGTTGFWRAYPALAKAGIDFEQMATPASLDRDPRLGWGFYGHRLALYRHTLPHGGFKALHRLVEHVQGKAFVVTSNVDGQFQKAGFDPDAINEDHGSIHMLQCTTPCSQNLWSADGLVPEVDEQACQWLSDLPRCPRCGALARPNILMFADNRWVERRQLVQEGRQKQWLSQVRSPLILELGAGTSIGSMRSLSERLAVEKGGYLIRVNPREHQIPERAPGIGLALGAREALHQLVSYL